MERFRPTTADAVDAVLAVLLGALAVYGFRTTFGGGEELSVGVPAVVVGTVVGFVLVKARVQLLVAAAVAVAVYFLLGGLVALRADPSGGLLPTPAVLADLVDGSINGWARLLTTVPPAGRAGNLLAVPYLAGYFGGLLAVSAAVAFPRWPVCVVPPATVLAVTVLFGVDDPASLLLQGSVFGGLAIIWISLRVRRVAPTLLVGGARRALGGAVLVGVAAAAAFVVGPNLPGAGANERFLLRERVQPPFDPSQYPSPLARFRKFHGQEPIEEPLFVVEGLPAGAAIRFAVMDDYDGFVWRASPPGTSLGGDYLRVGDRIPHGAGGDAATLRFEMGALADVDSVWIPTAGSPTSITFTGARAEALTEQFRYNPTTETAASPLALERGDTWQVETTFPAEPEVEDLEAAPVAGNLSFPTPPGLADQVMAGVTSLLVDAGAEEAGPYVQMSEFIRGFHVGAGYDDGDVARTPAGHGLRRLIPFLTEDAVGNGEQFAAAAAYAARALGIPSRVVLEFRPAGAGSAGPVEVRADDAYATVEIAVAGLGWVELPNPTPPEDQRPEPETQVAEQEEVDAVQPPPPTTVPPPPSLPEDEQRLSEDDLEEDEAAGSSILGLVLLVAAVAALPVVLIAAPSLVVVALKARRRRRRRSRGSPAQRVAAAWTELVDLARDAGAAVPLRATRSEVARLVPAGSATALADEADACTFGGADPEEHDAVRVWDDLGRVRSELLDPLGLPARFRVAVSLSSLRSDR